MPRFKALQDLVRPLFVAAGLIASRVGGLAATLAYTLILTRLIPAREVGDVAALTSGLTIGAVLATLNYQAGVSRHLVQAINAGDERTAASFMATGRLVLFIGSPVVALGHYFLMRYWNPTISPTAVGLASLAIPFLAATINRGGIASQLGNPLGSQFANLVFRPVSLLLMVAAIGIAGLGLNETVVAGAMLASCVLAWVAQHLLRSRLSLPVPKGPLTPQAFEWIRTGLILSPRTVVQQYLPDLTILAASVTLPPAEVALLMVTLRCVNIIRFSIVSLEMAVTPRLVRAEARNDRQQVDRLLTFGSQTRFWPVLAICGAAYLLAPYILQVFGERYAAADDALRLGLLLPLSMAGFGPSYILLIAKGYIKTVGLIAALALAVVCTLVPIAGAAFGLNGVVAVSTGTVAATMAAYYIALRATSGLDTSIVASSLRLLARSRARKDRD